MSSSRSLSCLAAALLCSVGGSILAVEESSAQEARATYAYVTNNLNQRAGPNTRFPALDVIPARAQITVNGCLEDLSWCEGAYGDIRGWMSATYLRLYDYNTQAWVEVDDYARSTRLPRYTFDLDRYWTARSARPPVLPAARGLARRAEFARRRQRRVLPRALALWPLDAARRPLRFHAGGPRGLAAIHRGPLGVHAALRLDVGVERALRLGHLSLRPLGILEPGRLGLGARHAMGAGLGRLARLRGSSRLGAAAARRRAGLARLDDGYDAIPGYYWQVVPSASFLPAQSRRASSSGTTTATAGGYARARPADRQRHGGQQRRRQQRRQHRLRRGEDAASASSRARSSSPTTSWRRQSSRPADGRGGRASTSRR